MHEPLNIKNPENYGTRIFKYLKNKIFQIFHNIWGRLKSQFTRSEELPPEFRNKNIQSEYFEKNVPWQKRF